MNATRFVLVGLFLWGAIGARAAAEDYPPEPAGGFQKLFQRTKTSLSRTQPPQSKAAQQAESDAARASWNQTQSNYAAAAKRTPPGAKRVSPPPDNRPKRPRTVSEYMAKERP